MDGQMDVVSLENIYTHIEESIAKASSSQDKLFESVIVSTGQDTTG